MSSIAISTEMLSRLSALAAVLIPPKGDKPGAADIAELDLSRICAAPSARLGHLAFEGQGAFSSQC